MIQVCAAVVFHQGKVLLASRPHDKDLAGFWEFPGGKLEANESHADCLERELKEELNLKIVVGDFLMETRFEYPNKTVQLFFYQCLADDISTLRPLENQTFEWVKSSEIPVEKMLPADQDIAVFLQNF